MKDEELVEGEAAPRGEQATFVIGKVHLPQCRSDVGKAMAIAQILRKRLGDLANYRGPTRPALDRGVKPPAHLAVFKPFGQPINRDQPAGMH